MEETHASPKMKEIDLIKNLEKISSEIPNRILKIQGYILKKNHKEQLEIIIFKGFSSSTTHPIEIDLEKKVIEFSYTTTKIWRWTVTFISLNFLTQSLQNFNCFSSINSEFI